jgi:cysteine desulfurase
MLFEESSMREPIYLDYNATTPVHASVVDAMLPFLTGIPGNASSAHAYGFRLRAALDHARAQVAHFVGAAPDEIVFTGCGSEANNLALKGLAFAHHDNSRRQIVISAVDHPSVANAARFLTGHGFDVTVLTADICGYIDVAAVTEAVSDRTLLLSIVHGQNEIGTIQAVAQISAAVHRHGGLVHTDAAQTAGKIPVDVDELGIDLLTIAGNKFYAPKGVGALYVRHGVQLQPLVHGGGHERGRRGGTENVAFAVGLGRAAELAISRLPLYSDSVRRLRDRLHDRIAAGVSDAVLNGHPTERLPNTLNLSFPGINSSALLALIRDRIACSTACGCHAGKSEPSATLLAIGRDDALASAALRLSLGAETAETDVDEAAAVVVRSIAELRSPRGIPATGTIGIERRP